ncbi:hypothetical protein D3C71_1637010 [compost metagenome]
MFRSTEVPQPGGGDQATVCGRVFPVPAYFGSLTPAVPTPQFLSLMGAGAGAVLRYHWRDCSSDHSRVGGRRYEHSVLAIKRASFTLPPGWQMVWSVRVNGEHLTTLNRY